MSYVVKGYKFPQSCRECWLVYPEGLHNCSCILTEKYWEFEEEMPSKSRLPECPLVEIPTPHGDLVNRDDLIDEINRVTFVKRYDYDVVYNIVTDAETIIEAEASK